MKHAVLHFFCVCSAVSLLFIFALPVFGQQATAIYNGRPVVADEILVRLRSNDAAGLARARSAMPFANVESLSPQLGLHVVRAPGNNVDALLRAFSGRPDVLYAEPNYILQSFAIPNDSLYASLWAMTTINAPDAWDINTGGTTFVAGVVDSGLDYTHPDLAGNVWSAPAPFTVTIQGVNVNCPAGSHGFNALNFTCDPLDDNNHGTHTSGTIGAAGNNSAGVAGVNWQARIMGLKFLNSGGSGPTSAAINAIEFAIQVKAQFASTATPVNVRVLSNSWGGASYSASLADEINKANANDMLFVAAAGNSSSNNDITPEYPGDYSTILPNVITVAATDASDNLAGFSNYGASNVQLGAPGVFILSTIRAGSYASFSGTSMATPHVAGAALLTLAACPTLTTATLKAAILSNVDPVPSLAGKTATGGRLNVSRMVRSCAPGSTLKATFVGATGEDTVGPASTSPSGVPDWHIQLQGLRGTPNRVQITSTSGGLWEGPFNGVNYIVLSIPGPGGTGDLYFEPWGSPGFHVRIFYVDGTTDEVDAVTASSGLRFVPVTPCRVADTRNPTGPFGGPILNGGIPRSLTIPASSCGIPATAQAYSLNVTVVPSGSLGYLQIWPTGQPQPTTSTLNSPDGRIKAGAAIVSAGTGGAVTVLVSDSSDVILDINGYFASPTDAPSGLLFYPVTPCRIVDTRLPNGPSGGPILSGGISRTVPVLSSACGLPATAVAYSLNLTAVPAGTLEAINVWPSGSPQPFTSTLNDLPGMVVSNAAIVPAGPGGSVDVYPTQSTHLIIDMNGYFAPPAAGGLLFSPTVPCRIADTRNLVGAFGGPALSGTRDFNIAGGPCPVPATARAYSLNATVVPHGVLGGLILWPAGQAQPNVSTLNSYDGALMSNAAIVPTNTGAISAYTTDTTDLILDLNGYFAP